jgi:hypothetical protein
MEMFEIVFPAGICYANMDFERLTDAVEWAKREHPTLTFQVYSMWDDLLYDSTVGYMHEEDDDQKAVV